jgi:hypothetical protein
MSVHLGVGVDVVEHRSTGVRVIDHAIQRRHDERGSHMRVVREERADMAQWHGGVVTAVVPRQQQTPEAREGRMGQDVADAVGDAEVPAGGRAPGRHGLRRDDRRHD